MSLEWQHLRPWHGSQHNAFEELCCILAASEPPPNALSFERKGAPDAGIESYWTLKNGDEWGYQAKFFLSPPNNTQWCELDESVKVALEKHPRLVRFTVCLPIDRPDPRLSGKKHMQDRWKERVEKWQGWAKGRTIEFEYWGQHELADRLSQDKHRGRYRFWFDRDRFSDEWFKNHLKEAVEQAGERYTAPLNVELPISQLFDGLARTPAFWHRLRQRILAIRDVAAKPFYSDFPAELEADRKDVYDKLRAVVLTANRLEENPAIPLELSDLTAALDAADKTVYEFSRKLDIIEESQRKAVETAENRSLRRYSDDKLNDCLRRLRDFSDALEAAGEFLESPQARLAAGRSLLVTGDAGAGKTHLLCDAAEQRFKLGFPTVVLFGEQFNTDDPWTNIIRLLGQTGSRDDLLSALDAAGEARRCRVLILLDAINEGEGLTIWPAHLAACLTVVARYAHLAIGLSVRTTYRNLVIQPPTLVPARLLEVEHTGFADRGYAAVRRYFGYYGLKQPSMPLLTPEFRNPLFLKLFCSAVKNEGLTEVPPGVSGITGVFDFFLRSINTKLAHPKQLNYDVTQMLVQKAVTQLSTAMAASNATSLPVATARAICDRLLPGREFERSLFRRLQTEGVIMRHINSWGYAREPAPPEEVVRFTYQRFSDHLLLKPLLAGVARPVRPAVVRKLAADLLKAGFRRGLLEALAIQLPEEFGIELPDVAPAIAADRSARQAFIESIAWRKSEAVTTNTRECINRHLSGERHEQHQLLDVLLMVSAHPNHLLNADFFHRHLLKFSMPERDAWWSVYLHQAYDEEGSVSRMIDWAWEEDDRSHLSDESVRLAATMLLWFCTTPNRFVRDRATKALVSLLEDRIGTLRKLIPAFWKVDDPYVTERLMAVAYGCAMRTADLAGLSLLAQEVYDTVFRGEPPAQLLLRDHARGVVAVAMQRGFKLNGDPQRLVPPFNSAWVKTPPTLKQLEKRYNEGKTQEEWARRAIYSSMTHGDFGVKVIDGYFEWTGRRRNSRRRSMQQIYDDFVLALKPGERLQFDYYISELNKDSSRRLAEILGEKLGVKPAPNPTLATTESILTGCLSKKLARTFRDKIKPFLLDPHKSKNAERFDLNLMRRWMLQRILQMGWTVKRFGNFDSNIRDPRGRDAHKPERMGKKYQWITYDEILARCSDNLEFDDSQTHDFPEESENGMWTISYRNIDPSLLLSAKPAAPENEIPPPIWWIPAQFDDWASKPAPAEWLKYTGDLVPIPSLLRIKDPAGRAMLCLEGFKKWKQPESIGKMAIQLPDRREVWLRWRSYLVRREHFADTLNWARSYDFMGGDLDRSSFWYHTHLGEHYWQPGFQARREALWKEPSNFRQRNWPHPLIDTCAEYLCENGTFDCSMAETVCVSIPCQFLFEGLKLRFSGRGVDCRNESRQLVMFDPSTTAVGPSCLIADEQQLRQFLDQSGLALFWGVCGEKNIYPDDSSKMDTEWMGRLRFNGCYSFSGDKMVGAIHTEFVEPRSR